MKKTLRRLADVRLLPLLVAGLSGDPALAADQRTTDMWLEQAGFVMSPANTPEHVRQMNAMPPKKFIALTSRTGTRYFLYADPTDCKCVFSGDVKARQNFKSIAGAGLPKADNNIGPGGVSPDNEIVADMTGDDRDVSDYVEADFPLFALPY